jgi:hypothetical protein
MKTSQDRLFKVAAKFQRKYAQSQSLKQIIENAASYGENSSNGIMNFPAQLKKDRADMNINVTISSGFMGGSNVEVSPPAVKPTSVAGNYARLPDQIKKYLEKYIKDFPQIAPGTQTLEYSGRTPASGVASSDTR